MALARLLPADQHRVVQCFSAYVGDPPLGGTVLPGILDATAKYPLPGRPQELDDIPAKPGVSIKDDIAVRTRIRKCLAKLLNDPVYGEVSGAIEGEDMPPEAPEEAVSGFEFGTRLRALEDHPLLPQSEPVPQ